ncbi:unnamed protein product, partial [Caretta caretta]
TGKKCGRPPDVANGDITTFSQKEYASGFSVEYKCQKFYSVKGQNKPFCNNGNWTETPICEEPCVISQEEMQNCGIELTETYYGKQYVQHDDFVVFKCKSGHVPLAFLSPDFTVWCHSGNIVYPQCNKHVLGKCGPPPSSQNGDIISDLLPVYAAGSSVEYKCQSFHGMTGSKIITCHLGKWTAPPVCSDMRCAPPPEIYDGRILGAKQQRYLPGDRMHYQCGRGLSFIGSLTVTCEEGKWSQMPECKAPKVMVCENAPEQFPKGGTCTLDPVLDLTGIFAFRECWLLRLCITSPEDMEKNNIGLKWSLEFRLNLESGDFVEFGCKNGYVRDPTSSAFRVKCVEGKLAYPKCKRRGTYE